MKTTHLLTLALVFFISTYSYAQNKPQLRDPNRAMTAEENGSAPAVTWGTIDGAITSRERVLAYPRLLPQALNCEVTGFEFTMTAEGKTMGPVNVKGAVADEKVKNMIKETEPTNVKISVTNIRVKCNDGDEMTAKPINLEYHH